jgi:hypothetical protein
MAIEVRDQRPGAVDSCGHGQEQAELAEHDHRNEHGGPPAADQGEG